ncbi:hypothetical protein [Streptomyces sp. NPDC059744]|uniref:hypothetical protein n=1 Tax=Streptomyces sp. NPDC059744 TaxID=3346929 RepID=UPI00364B9083
MRGMVRIKERRHRSAYADEEDAQSPSGLVREGHPSPATQGTRMNYGISAPFYVLIPQDL